MPVALGTAPAAAAGYEGYTLSAQVREPARLRALPGLDGAIVTTFDSGTTLVALGRAPGWIQVAYEDGTGWIARELLSLRGAIPNLPWRG